MVVKNSDVVYGEISYDGEQRHLDNTIVDNKRILAATKRIKANPYFRRIDIEYKDKKLSLNPIIYQYMLE